MVSIIPLVEFVEKVGGDKITVSAMVPPGASPHTFEPTPSQLVAVGKATMYVKVGSPIDFEVIWLDKILSSNKDIFLVNASSGVEIFSNEYTYHNYDPHIWLSPGNAKIIVGNIYNGFVSIDPDNKKYYAANKETYIKELDELDIEIEQILSKKTNRVFIVYHPAWSYYARDYNLKQIPIEAEGKEPTLNDIKYLIDQARKLNIKIIFASQQFNKETAEVIAREIKGSVILINPLEKNYINNMKKVTNALSKALE